MPSTVPAYAAPSANAELAPTEIERRDLRPDDVRIAIRYCGVCHTDVHQIREEWGGALFPMVPGHEIVGEITEVGSNVTKFGVGDLAGIGCFVDSCGECANCKAGTEQYCDVGMVMTYNAEDFSGERTYGGYSSEIVAKADYVLRIPAGLDLAAAAPLLCAGITVYDPLKHWGAGPGKQVAVVGLGGLGHVAVKIAHAMGAEVTVLTHSASKVDDAKTLGADHWYLSTDPGTFDKLARRFDIIINTVSVNLPVNDYLNLLTVSGTLVTVAVPQNDTVVGPFALLVNRRSMAGSQIGGIGATQEMLDFCAEHGIGAEIELIDIADINRAFDRMVKSDVRYRFVIDNGTLQPKQ